MTTPMRSAEKKGFELKKITWGDFTWVDIVQPGKEAMEYLTSNYRFNPLDLEDAVSPRQLPKTEDYPEYLFVIAHFSVFDKAARKSSRKQWSAFVGEKFLVTLRPPELKVADELFRQCELSEETREQHFRYGPGYLLYQIFDRFVDNYFRVLDKIREAMEDVEDNVFKEEVEVARELSVLRRDIINQKQVMLPTRALLGELEKKLKRFARTDLTLFLSDLMDHMNKICETLDEFAEVIDVFKDADYLLSSYRANRAVRTLALLAAIVAPFVVVGGIYIMLPGTGKGSAQDFILLLVIALVLMGAFLLIFRRRRLI